MGRSQETFNKKEVRNKKEKKRKEKEMKRLARKEKKPANMEEMIAYVDENGMLTDTPPDPKKKKKIKLEHIEISTPKADDMGAMDPIRKGNVTFFNDAKGFGFIKDSETQESIFVHVNNTIDDIREHSKVIFEIVMGPKGPTATQVKLDR